MKHLLATTALALTMTLPALAGTTLTPPRGDASASQAVAGATTAKPAASDAATGTGVDTGSATEAHETLEGQAVKPNDTSNEQIDSQAAAPEVQVKQDASEAQPDRKAIEAHKKNVLGSDTQTDATAPAATGDTTGSNTGAATGNTTLGTATGMAPADVTFLPNSPADALSASALIGARVYAYENDVAPAGRRAEDQVEDIGEVNDIIVGQQGEVVAVVLGVGGFLGLGEKDVAVDMSALKVMRDQGDTGDWWLLVRTSRNTLESAPAFERVARR